MTRLLRLYEPHELTASGYPYAWKRCPTCKGHGTIYFGEEPDLRASVTCAACEGCARIPRLVRADAGHRCIRCHHPYRTGEHGTGEWTNCEADCDHAGPFRVGYGDDWVEYDIRADAWNAHLLRGMSVEASLLQARWRILTVHHLDGDKANCCWWNLAALCQRCHLKIQGKVIMARVWPWEHSEWFQPYVAGYYAHVYLGEDLTRTEVEARVDELLGLERAA